MWNWKNQALRFIYGMHAESLMLGQPAAKNLILLYHNIFPKTERSFNVRNLGVEEFDRQLKYLKKRYAIVPLETLYTENSAFPRIAITFDDGLINNLELAMPVLKQHKAPATVFVSTPILQGRQVIWPDWLCMMGKSGCSRIHFEGEDYDYQNNGTFRSKGGRKLSDVWRKYPTQTIYEFLDKLERSFGDHWRFQRNDENYWRIMKGEEIKILANDPLIEIGGHTVTHPSLTIVNHDECTDEILSNKIYLEQCIGKKIDSFAFPFGDYDQNTLQCCLEIGYKRILGVKLNEVRHQALKGRFGIYNNEAGVGILHQINTALHEKH